MYGFCLDWFSYNTTNNMIFQQYLLTDLIWVVQVFNHKKFYIANLWYQLYYTFHTTNKQLRFF